MKIRGTGPTCHRRALSLAVVVVVAVEAGCLAAVQRARLQRVVADLVEGRRQNAEQVPPPRVLRRTACSRSSSPHPVHRRGRTRPRVTMLSRRVPRRRRGGEQREGAVEVVERRRRRRRRSLRGLGRRGELPPPPPPGLVLLEDAQVVQPQGVHERFVGRDDGSAASSVVGVAADIDRVRVLHGWIGLDRIGLDWIGLW
jgi:hypothetical protein